MTGEDKMEKKESEPESLRLVDLLNKPDCSWLMNCVHGTECGRNSPCQGIHKVMQQHVLGEGR